MPNTNSAKKAVRSSLKKKAHNQLWKNRVKTALKAIKTSITDKVTDEKVIAEQLTTFQKTLDKAAKEKVIHKNKANRLKSNYAKKTADLVKKVAAADAKVSASKPQASKPAKKAKSASKLAPKSKSKSRSKSTK